MKKYFQLKEEEKAALAIGALMIAVVLTTGPLKQKFVKAETYVSLKEEQQSVNVAAAKKETFIIRQSVELSQKVETCVNVDSDVLKKVKPDLPMVGVTTPSTYQAVALSQKERVFFTIKAVENAKSVIQAARTDLQFVIESNPTMQEVRDYAGATAADASGSDLSVPITGWGEELPVEVKVVTYQPDAEDVQGQRAKKSVRVQYLPPKEGRKDQC